MEGINTMTIDWSLIVTVVAALAAVAAARAAVVANNHTKRELSLLEAERIAGHRLALYSKQIEAYDAVIKAAIAFYGSTLTSLRASSFKSKGDILKIIEGTPSFRDLEQVSQAWVVYLPTEIGKALADLKYSFMDVQRSPDSSLIITSTVWLK